jgi:hypothetical protein
MNDSKGCRFKTTLAFGSGEKPGKRVENITRE